MNLGFRRLALWLSLAAALSPAARGTEREDWRNKMRSIIPLGYAAPHTPHPFQIDGNLDKPAWAAAPWTTDFVDIEGNAKPTPRFRTRVKMLWDDQYLYIAAELEEPHVWATLTAHDSVIFKDPDFEVFIDPAGNTQPYYEFEINALNTGWDLLLEKPYMDGGPPRNEWEIPGLKTAVRIQGTLNQPNDVDRGWTVEIAFPWRVLSAHASHPGAPKPGEQWRINFSRVEWRITNDDKTYQKVPATPEDNWVWTPQGVIDMHRPEMWGLVQFLPEAAAKKSAVIAPLSGKEARDVSLEIYYAQLDFFKANNRWAATLAELAWTSADLPAGLDAPVLKATPTGYECVVGFSSDRRHRRWHILQDRKLWLE